MGSSYGILKLSCKLLLICIIIAAPHGDAAITCDNMTKSLVTKSLTPCMMYLVKGGTVPPQCCTGVKKLNVMARTKQDRQKFCTCLKDAYQSAHSRHPGVTFDRAKAIPQKCGVNIRYAINSPTPNCNTVT